MRSLLIFSDNWCECLNYQTVYYVWCNCNSFEVAWTSHFHGNILHLKWQNVYGAELNYEKSHSNQRRRYFIAVVKLYWRQTGCDKTYLRYDVTGQVKFADRPFDSNFFDGEFISLSVAQLIVLFFALRSRREYYSVEKPSPGVFRSYSTSDAGKNIWLIIYSN